MDQKNVMQDFIYGRSLIQKQVLQNTKNEVETRFFDNSKKVVVHKSVTS